MSATAVTTITATAPVRRRVAPRPPVSRLTYLRRRALVGVGAALVAMVLAVACGWLALGLLAGLGGDPASASGALPASSASAPDVYVARSGDTLWSIAEEFHGDVGFDRYLRALIDGNGGTAIQSGQAIRLP